MLQNDATQAGSTPDARNDVDLLNQCDLGPATGNTITGQGTVSGAAGADATGGAAATIVAVQGAGGADSGTDGSFQVEGSHGTLTMQADGSYSYARNASAPDGVSDVFTYTLANEAGARDTATLTINIRCEEEDQPEEAQNLITTQDGVVMLPAGVELSDIRVVGRDLIITMPDGSQMVIPGGAVFVPQLVIGDVEVPPANLAALLIESEPQPAAGTPQSSGGNFGVDVPPLDPGVPLGDLIPPTELDFTPPTFEEPAQFIDEEPEVFIQPDGQPRSVNAVDEVDEAGLPARDGNLPNEPEGSNAASDSETTGGVIIVDSPDGPSVVTIVGANGVPVPAVAGAVIEGEFGTMTIVSVDGNEIRYSYTLNDNTSPSDGPDNFSVTVTDNDGDTATATLTINIIDDVPTAVDDTDSIAAGDFNPATGNVITDDSAGDEGDGDDGADTVGADDAELTDVSGAGDTTVGENGEFIVEGEFGVLTISADGEYSYVRNPGTPGGGTDTFTYTLTDGDGDTDTATLTIDIEDLEPSLETPAAVQLDDDVLPNGNPGGEGDDPDPAVPVEGQLEASGGDGDIDFFFSADQGGLPDGFTTNQLDDSTLQIFQGETLVITVTLDNETGEYSVVQNNPVTHPEGGDENNIPNINVSLFAQDADGDESEPVNLTIDVDDDTPEINRTGETAPTLLVDETDLATDASGDFSTLFSVEFGADGEGSTSFDLTVVAGTDSGLVDVATGDAILLFDNDGVIEGRVGGEGGEVAFTVSVDGEGVVTLDQVRAVQHPDDTDHDDPVSPEATSIQLTLSATDADGDPVSETINIGGNLVLEDDGPSVTGAVAADGVTLDETEAGLPTGFPISATSTGAVITAGTAFGADGAGSVAYGLALQGGGNGIPSGLATAIGDQPITLYIDGNTVEGRFGANDGEVAFTITIDPETGQVTVVQNVPLEHLVDGSSAEAHDDPLDLGTLVEATVTVTDRDGDIASDSAAIGDNIVFEDDGPIARNDTDSVAEGASTDGNVLTGADTTSGDAGADSPGADGFAAAPDGAVTGITSVNQGTSDTIADGSGDFELAGEWGTLTLNRDGSYSYTANPNTNPTGPDVFTYTVIDADGDTSTATLTINVQDVTLVPDNDTQTVNEAALDTTITGDDVAAGTVTGSDPGSTAETVTGALSVAGATTFTLDSPAVGSFGTLELNADGTYTYTLTQPVDSTPDANDGTNTELGAEVFTYTATDADGNSVQGTITINIIDDVPSVDVTATNETGVTLETDDADTIAGASDADSSTADFSGVFDITFVEGADGATVTPDIDFELGVQSQGVNSGLTQGGQPIFLYLIGTTVVGSTSNSEAGVSAANTVFDVTVDGDGVVTLTQHSQLDHPIADDQTATEAPFNDQFVSLADDLITLTGSATITDNDGDIDTDSQTVGIGTNLQFTDDGPIAVNDSANQGTENANVTVDVFANDSAGADGVNLATGIAVVPGTLSGAGILTYNGDGTFTYDPANNEEGPVTFDYEITDADGDTATATVTINLQPDSNPQPVNAVASVDDEGLDNGITGGDGDLVVPNTDGDNNEATFGGTLTANFGGDAPGTFSFAAMDEATGTVGTEDVEYSLSGNTLTATITSGARAGTDLFEVTLNPTTGAYSVTLLTNVLHADDGTDTENDASAVLTFTATDSETESANGTLTITFDDDTPITFVTEGTDVPNEVGGTGGGSLDTGDGNISNNTGADGGTVQFHPDLDGADSGLESGMLPIIYSLSADGQTLTATAGGSTVFVVTLDQESSSYSIEMFGEIDSFTQIDFNDGSRNFVGGNEPWAGFNTLANDDSADLLLTPIVNGVSQTTTNTNANSGGIDNNFVDNGEAYRLDFVTDLTGDNAGSDYEEPGQADHVFDGHYTTNGASALIVSTTSATVRAEAFVDPDGNDVVGDGTHVDVTGVAISYNGFTSTLITESGDYQVNGRTFTVTFNADGTVDVGNVEGGSGPNPGGTRIAVFTEDGYNSLTFTNVGDDAFRIGDFGAAIPSTDPVPFELPVVIIDGDGDLVEGTPIEINAVSPLTLTATNSSSMTTLANDNVEQQLKTMNAANTNAVFLGAIAAAGLTAAPAAANVPDFRPLDLVDTADLPAFSMMDSARSLDVEARSALLDQSAQPTIDSRAVADTVGSQGNADAFTSGLTGADSEAQVQAVSQLAQGTDAPAQTQATDSVPVADAIAMPSAEALAAAAGGGVDAEAASGELGRVLADALAGGQNGPNIDAVLDAVSAASPGGNAAAEAAATHLAANVPAWDSSVLAHFNGAHSAYTTDALMAHIDAAPATAA